MKDRVPKYPGRVTLLPVTGKENTYDMVRADEPEEEGTALNKNNILTDETAEAVGLDPINDPTPNDAFFKLSRLEALRAGDTITTAQAITDPRFLKCRGQGIPKDDYPDLYKAIPERFVYQGTDLTWSATVTNIYPVGDYFIKPPTSDDTPWYISSNGTSGWAILPYTGTMYYSSGYYILGSGYICINEAAITDSTGWKQITCSNGCIPADKVNTREDDPNSDLVDATWVYSLSYRSYIVTEDKVFISSGYETPYECYSQEGDGGYDEATGEYIDDTELYSYYRKYFTSELYAVNASDLLQDDLNYKTVGTFIVGNDYCAEYYDYYWIDESTGDWGITDPSETVYTGKTYSYYTVIRSGGYYYLDCGLESGSYTLYLLDVSTGDKTLVFESSRVILDGQGMFFPRNGYLSTSKIFPFSSTVYGYGTKFTLTVPSGKYIFAIGYDCNTNSIVYVVHADSLTGSNAYPWDTYAYNLDTGKTVLLDRRASLLTSENYGRVLSADGDGRLYFSSNKLVYNLGTRYVLPTYVPVGDDKYMKVSL